MINMMQKTLAERQAKSKKLLEQGNRNRVPVIIDKNSKSKKLVKDTEKLRVLVLRSQQLCNLSRDIRCKPIIDPVTKKVIGSTIPKPDESVFFFCNNVLLQQTLSMEEIYNKHKNEDGFLYLTYSETPTLG